VRTLSIKGLAPCTQKPTQKQNIHPFKFPDFYLPYVKISLFALFVSFDLSTSMGSGSDLHTPLSHIRMSLASAIGGGHVIFLAGIDATENKVRRDIYSKLSSILSFVV